MSLHEFAEITPLLNQQIIGSLPPTPGTLLKNPQGLHVGLHTYNILEGNMVSCVKHLLSALCEFDKKKVLLLLVQRGQKGTAEW